MIFDTENQWLILEIYEKHTFNRFFNADFARAVDNSARPKIQPYKRFLLSPAPKAFGPSKRCAVGRLNASNSMYAL
jgi:hypothetical protein